METGTLKELEELVNEELKIVDVYRYPITKEDMPDIRKYFTLKKGFKFHMESSHPTNVSDLSKKYTVVFQKSGGGQRA